MPGWTEEAEKASALKRRAAKVSRDKAVEAQRKNKLETASLQLYHAMLDRKKVHTTVVLNREKDELRATMKSMRKTTGFCKEALPPEGPKDKDHEKSPYFQTTGHVSEKRLQKWKNEEKALQRILLSEEELRPPWEKGSLEVAEETLGHLLNILGYDKDEAKVMMEKLKEKEAAGQGEEGEEGEEGEDKEAEVEVFEPEPKPPTVIRNLRSASASSFGGASVMSEPIGRHRVDVFECLKDSRGVEESVIKNGGFQGPGALRTKLLSSASADNIFQPTFSVRDWERQMTERYQNRLINLAGKCETKTASEEEAQHVVDDNRGFKKNRPKSAPAKTGTALRSRSLLARRRQRRERGGSEGGQQGAVLSGGVSITDLRTTDGESTDSTTPLTAVHLRPPSCPRRRQRPLTALPPRAVEAAKDSSRPRTAYRKVPTMLSPSPPSSHTSRSHDEPDGIIQIPTATPEAKIPTPPSPKPPKEPVLQRPNTTKSISTKRERTHVSPELKNSQVIPSGAKTDDLHAIKEEPEDVTPRGVNRKPGVNALPDRHRKLSSAPILERAVPRASDYQRSLSLPANSPSLQRSNSLIPTGDGTIKNKLLSSRRMTLAVVDDLDESDNEKDVDPSQDGENDLRAQWRRNLLRDAPPGLSGQSEKIKLAVSKNQLRRDMEQMVVDHESNMKDKIREEHSRKMRKRMDIMLTLQKLAKPVEEEVSDSKPSEAPKLATSVNTIMQLLNLKKKARNAKAVVAAKRSPGALQEQSPAGGDATTA